MIVPDATPAVTGTGEVVNTSCVAAVAFTVSVWVGALVRAPVPDAVITGLPALVSFQKKLAVFADVEMLTLVIEVVQPLLL